MKLHNPNFPTLCSTYLHMILLFTLLCLHPTTPTNETDRLALLKFKESITNDPEESWAYGIILFSSATGMELHVAATIKESRHWHYRGINCVEPLHLTLETSPFLQPSTSKTTAFMVKFQRKLVICFDCDISIFQITHWEEKFQLAWPIAPNSR